MFFGPKQRPEMRKISFPCRSLRILGYCLVFCDAQAARCRHDCVPRVLHPYSSPVGQWVGQSIFKESINYLILFFKKLIVLPIVLPEAFQNPQAGAGRFLPAVQVVKELRLLSPACQPASAACQSYCATKSLKIEATCVREFPVVEKYRLCSRIDPYKSGLSKKKVAKTMAPLQSISKVVQRPTVRPEISVFMI